MSKPILTKLAFESLDKNQAILAGSGVFSSSKLANDSKYIAVPAVLHKDIFIYYSFDEGSPRLYRLKRGKSRRNFNVGRSTARNMKKLLIG